MLILQGYLDSLANERLRRDAEEGSTGTEP